MVELKIIKAKYGTKDVTTIVSKGVINNKLIVAVNNSTFGDPNPGVVKTLDVDYSINGIKKSISVKEGSVMTLPITDGNKLGIFYTNNRIDPRIISKSLETIKIASERSNVDILTCSWETIPNNPFYEMHCSVRTGNHFNIAYQICQLLSTAGLNSSKKYETVSFLEHDVIYGEDYFDYNDFNGDVICNHNYMGISKKGFQHKGQSDEPLHQLTLKYDYAVSHFKNILYDSISLGVNLEPPHSPPYLIRESNQPSVHINHGNHFTSHFNIYQKKYFDDHPYWGNYKDIYIFD